jgi:hypothetical protein
MRTGVGDTGSRVVSVSSETTSSVSADVSGVVVMSGHLMAGSAVDAAAEGFGTSVLSSHIFVSVIRQNPRPCAFTGCQQRSTIDGKKPHLNE